MNTSSVNLCVDITLGITGFLLLLIYFINTEEYAVFQLAYYYYLIAAMSIITKYALTENVSANDLYVIHFTTAFLAVVPFCLKEIKGSPPDNILDNAQKTYIYFWTVLFTLVGIAINTLVLISGGLIGLNICNNHLISQ